MSVIVAKRRPSEVQFLEDARKLEIYTFQRTIKMPKRYNHFKTMLENFAINCYNKCKLANSVYIRDNESIEQRRKYFEDALNNMYLLNCQLDIASELKLCENITDKQWAHWLGLVYNLIEQIKKIEKSDCERLIK